MKNDCLNVWKAAAAFSVVLIHCRFPGDAGMAAKAAARFAVPFFFMISGYFSYGKGKETIRRRAIRIVKTLIIASAVYLVWKLARFAVPFFFMISGYFSYGKGKETIRRRAIRIVKTLIIASAVYLVWKLVEFSLGGEMTGDDLKIMFSVKAMRSFLLFNQSPFMFHLWFLGSLLYCYLFYEILIHTGKEEKLYFLIPAMRSFLLFNQSPFMFHLWFLGSLLYCYLFYEILIHTGKEEKLYFLIPLLIGASLFLGEGVEAMGGHTPIALVRNFWLTGLPFFLWGHWFAARCKRREGGRLFSSQTWLLAFFAAAALSVAEWFFLGEAELYLGSVLAAGAIFFMALSRPDFGRGSLLARIGERDSQHIYLWHVLVYRVLVRLAHSVGFNEYKLYQWLLPLGVCLASWMLAEILERRKRA